MTRIIAGTVGGRRLQTPRGATTRPTTDRVREAMFASLETMIGGFEDASVLDLYAGSGALGIEALSRGAASTVFVEAHRPTAQLIQRNLAALDLSGSVEATPVSAFMASAAPQEFDLILCDPPYDIATSHVEAQLASLLERGFVAGGAIVVVERGSRSENVKWPDGLQPVREKRYGETVLWYGRADEAVRWAGE